MNNINKDILIKMFTDILSGNNQVIQEHEKIIFELAKLQNFTLMLMDIADDKNNQIQIRQFALTTFKRIIEEQWHESKQHNHIYQPDKILIKQRFLQSFITVIDARPLQKLYESIFHKMVQEDERENWQFLFQSVHDILQKGDNFQSLLAALLIFKNFIATHQYKLNEDRVPLEAAINLLLPALQELVAKIILSFQDQTAVLLIQIMKIFFLIFFLDVPQFFKNNIVFLEKWMMVFKWILEFDVSPELKVYHQNHEQELKIIKSIQWRLKKAAWRIVQRFMMKASNNKEKSNETYNYFYNNFSQIFLNKAFIDLELRKKQYVSTWVLHYSIKYIFSAIKIPDLFIMIQNSVEFLMFDVCVPLAAMNKQDIELWEQEPEEFLRKEDDFSFSLNNIKQSSLDLLEELCKRTGADNQKYLIKLVIFFKMSLEQGAYYHNKEVLDFNKIDGILWLFGKLRGQISNDKILKDQIEPMLEKFVLPLFQNNDYLKARACQLYGNYGQLNYKNKQTIKTATEQICMCMQHPNLIIKVKASCALNYLIKQKECTELLKPNLQQLLKVYLDLVEQYESEQIVDALEGIIQNFQTEITPYAVELCTMLSKQFFKFIEGAQEQDMQDNDNEGELELAAAGTINAINQILKSPLEVQQYQQLFFIVKPVIDQGISDEQTEYIEEAYTTLSIFLSKMQFIDIPQLWFYYQAIMIQITGLDDNINVLALDPNLCSDDQKMVLEGVKSGWGIEFSDRALKCLKNYIKKGGEQFLQKIDYFGTSFVELIHRAIDKSLEFNSSEFEDTEMVNLNQLYMCLIENNMGRIDNHIQFIIQKTYQNFKISNEKSFFYSQSCFAIFSLCFFYNSQITFNFLKTQNIVHQFFGEWLAKAKSFKKDYDLQRLMLGFSSIFKLPLEDISLINPEHIQKIVQLMTKLTKEILALREEDDSDEGGVDDGKGNKKKEDEDEDEEGLNDAADDYLYAQYDDGYNSPLEDIDEILYFRDILLILSTNQDTQVIYEGILKCLTQPEIEELKKDFEESQKQYDQYLANKLQQNNAN